MANRVAALFFREKLATFEWSCAPMFGWLDCLCIPLSATYCVKTQHYSRRSYYELKKKIGILLLLVNVGRISALIIVHFEWFSSNKPKQNNNNNTTGSAIMWSFLINLFNQSFITIGCHLALIASTLANWKSLIAVFCQMEKHKMFHLNTFRQFRRISQWGLLCMYMVHLFSTTLLIQLSLI